MFAPRAWAASIIATTGPPPHASQRPCPNPCSAPWVKGVDAVNDHLVQLLCLGVGVEVREVGAGDQESVLSLDHRRNGLAHFLTGREVLLPHDDGDQAEAP